VRVAGSNRIPPLPEINRVGRMMLSEVIVFIAGVIIGGGLVVLILRGM
jgi:hypothetical protein